eukprot:426212-Prymnesium_polylepis.2
MFAKETLELTWWPLFRDCSYYSISLITLAYFFGVRSKNEIETTEALILFAMYLGYCTFMYFNQRIYGCIQKCCTGREALVEEGQTEATTTPNDGNAFLSAFKYRPTIGAMMSDPAHLEQAFASEVIKETKGGVSLAFDSLDVDKNGTIDLEELRLLLRKLGHAEAPDNILKQVRAGWPPPVMQPGCCCLQRAPPSSHVAPPSSEDLG